MVDGLKELGALGMKIEERYGGLGLSQIYYNRALALASSAHSSLGALLSAHQSIGVSEPLRLFGTEEQKDRWLPLVARTHISAFLLTEPDVGATQRAWPHRQPHRGRLRILLNGVKLWATNGAIADVSWSWPRCPRVPGHRGGITAFVVL